MFMILVRSCETAVLFSGYLLLFLSTAYAQSQPLQRALKIASNPSVPEKAFFGDDADWKDHKWQVELTLPNTVPPFPFCGGISIADKWIVTAAHCVDNNTQPADFQILSGVDDLSSATTHGKMSNVGKIYILKTYGKPNNLPNNDIALLELTESALGTFADLLLLSDELATMPVGAKALITGFGLTESGKPAPKLQKAEMPIVDRGRCSDPNVWGKKFKDAMICAGADGEQSARGCNGDSGGPLMIKDKLVGIVSWGPQPCDAQLKYTVFTRVSLFSDQVKSCVARPQDCREHWIVSP